MNSLSRNRVQRGIPTGGQFAAEQHSDPTITLSAPPARNWGEVNLQEGSRTPWGQAQEVRHYAPGIAVVTCAGHGGIKLSPERNREVPPSLRRSSGWYEEDCEFQIAGMYFPEETRPRAATGHTRDWELDEWKDYCRSSVRGWFPDGYEKATGETVLPGQSSVRDRETWLAAHVDDWVCRSATNLGDGTVAVTATRQGEEKRFVVPRDEYSTRSENKELGAQGTFIVDPARHRELPPEPVKPKTAAPRFHGVDTSGLTDLQRSRANNELCKRWRSEDGRVRTMREIIEEEGITGKTAYTANGKTEYHLSSYANVEDSSGYSFPVSKALWDAVDAPDRRTAAQRAGQRADRAFERWQNADWSDRKRAKAAYEKLAAEAEQARAQEREAAQ